MIHQYSERKSNGRAATTAMVGKRDDVHMRRCCNLAANRADGAVCEGIIVEDGGRGDWPSRRRSRTEHVCVVGPMATYSLFEPFFCFKICSCAFVVLKT